MDSLLHKSLFAKSSQEEEEEEEEEEEYIYVIINLQKWHNTRFSSEQYTKNALTQIMELKVFVYVELLLRNSDVGNWFLPSYLHWLIFF